MESSIEKALEDAGLKHREVTPFLLLRVVGLTYKTRQDKPKEGIITIWNPTEKQVRLMSQLQSKCSQWTLPYHKCLWTSEDFSQFLYFVFPM